ncbi:MAG TPA: hypothetical protein PKD54_08090, partial [Pirellulaceae bacterium]|nr:hypothetical protein [Pirellulaceae bacterium]
GLLFVWIPKAAILPILIFIGLEIAAQSYHATPRRHYAALAVACLPALAKLIMIYMEQVQGFLRVDQMDESTLAAFQRMQFVLLYLHVLAGGFIVSSLLWSSMLAEIIDRRFLRATIYVGVAALLTFFGVIHSPLAGDRMFWIGQIEGAAELRIVVELVVCYAIMGGLLLVIARFTRDVNRPIHTDEEFDSLGSAS